MRELLIITGTTSGIGKAVVEQYRRDAVQGSASIEINRSHHQDQESDDTSSKVSRFFLRQDLARGISQEMLNHIFRETPLVNKYWDAVYLVNNAGENVMAPIRELCHYDDLTRLFRTNIISPMYLTSLVVDLLMNNPPKDRSRLSIVNVSSVAAHVPMRMTSMYGSTKAALSQFTRNAARELASEGISVNEVRPGRVSGTKMGEKVDAQVCELRGWTLEEAKKYEAQYIPTGKVATPAEVADVIWHLLRAPSSVTGNSYLISNGQM